MKYIVLVFTETFKNPVVNFLLFWAANVMVYVTVFGGLMAVVPPRLDWITNIVFPLCIVGGFITSTIAVKKAKGILPSPKAVAQAGVTGLVGLLVLIAIYTASLAIKPTEYITTEQFKNANLTPNQIAQLKEYLDNKGYITVQDLDNINLTFEQKVAVNKVLRELGYITQEDSIYIARTQIALVFTQTAIAKITTCYITPEQGKSTVAVRFSPSDKSEMIGAFSEGQKLYVVGHNGGRVNQDKWWLVEFNNDSSEKIYGWVASWVVIELNEAECVKVEKTPGY